MPHALIDSHCHFDFEPLQSKECWSACVSAGVKGMLVPGVAPEQWSKAQACCELAEPVYFAAGVHPWWVEKITGDFTDQLADTLQHQKCVAIGECGLDGLIDFPLEKQLPIFEQQLALTAEHDLPIVIHSVKAHNEVIRLLKHHQPPNGGVIHAFTGSYEIAKTYWNMGFYLGVGGSITYPRARKTRDAITRIPLEAILLETDAPDMPLCGHQGEPNSPEYLPHVAKTLAELKGITAEEVAHATVSNTLKVFKKMKPF